MTATRMLLGLGIALLVGVSAAAKPRPPLPIPHSNNAVAKLTVDGGTRFYSFLGLTSGKTYADISKQAFEYDVARKRWRALPDVPVAQGRLASTAVAIRGRVYLFGGYSVAADGTEVSTAEVFAFDPRTRIYSPRAPMPVPVDDSVALPFGDRYVFLVSGWHNQDNVSLVQVYDTLKDRWFRASDWPGAPVFGHAGGIVGNRLVVVDGVTRIADPGGKHHFQLVSQDWLGTIDRVHPDRIVWSRLPPHPGAPLYRTAATGASRDARIVFAGGSETAYNYNGQGYDGTPAVPSARIFAFDLRHRRWQPLGTTPKASMDHRGLLETEDQFFTIGGMDHQRQVIGDLIPFALPSPH